MTTQTNPIITENDRERQPTASLPPAPRASGVRLAALAGLLAWLASPPFAIWPLAWIALAPLVLAVTHAARLRQALWRGYVFGGIYFGACCYWVGTTVQAWTRSQIGWLVWLGLTLIMASFYALWGGAAWWLQRRTSGGGRVVALTAAWVVMEWTRTLGALTMPWTQFSYTQYRFLPVLQIADTTGAYGVSFLLVLVNVSLAAWWIERKRQTLNRARYLWASLTLVGLTCLYGAARLIPPDIGPQIVVTALQTGEDPFLEREDRFSILRQIAAMTEAAAAQAPTPPDLYLWPETAAPKDALTEPLTRQTLTALAERNRAAILIGSQLNDTTTRITTNTALLFLPNGATPQRYDKEQLVTFGEFIPYRAQLPSAIIASFHLDAPDLTPGATVNPLRFTTATGQAVAVGPFICYEAMYPYYARAMTSNGADLLVSPSNDAWFHSQGASEQQLAATVLRGIENRREVVRASTWGVTGALDSKGRITRRAPFQTVTSLTARVRLQTGRTLYTRFGDWFVALCGVGLIAAVTKEAKEAKEKRGGRNRPSSSNADGASSDSESNAATEANAGELSTETPENASMKAADEA